MPNPIHPDFEKHLSEKSQELIGLFKELRLFILEQFPESNELLYHTHALTALFTPNTKMGDSFCMIPIYTDHLNLGFNKGTLLKDPDNLLQGTGKFIRHIPIKTSSDFQTEAVKNLLKEAWHISLEDIDGEPKEKGKTISKIKK